MIILIICMLIQMAMCYPDYEDSVYYKLEEIVDTDEAERSAVSAKHEVPTSNYRRPFKGQVFKSVTDFPKGINLRNPWFGSQASKTATGRTGSPTPKTTIDEEEIKEALRRIVGNRIIDSFSKKSSPSTLGDISTSTQWFTMRSVSPSTTATIEVTSVTSADTSPETSAVDLLSLKVANEVDMTTVTDENTMYDDEDTSDAVVKRNNAVIRKREDDYKAGRPCKDGQWIWEEGEWRCYLCVPNGWETEWQYLFFFKTVCKGRRVLKYTTTTTTTTTTTPKSTRRRLRTTTKPRLKLDIPALLALIANLTVDYNTNLTRMLNESLEKYSIPTCPTPTTTTTEAPVITTDAYANLTGSIISKCFVCGLQEEGIPQSAPCSDAFAGDFLPLVPVDPTARAQISTFRKYCRFKKGNRFIFNASDPRSMWGEWTGGCSVRWIDVSGIYTQRTCRNKNSAVLGSHFVSKRMAKLELALQNVDNGCIISPAASLVPISRGVSLYARFHVCVCTGNWCNRAPSNDRWTPHMVSFPIIMRAIFIYLNSVC